MNAIGSITLNVGATSSWENDQGILPSQLHLIALQGDITNDAATSAYLDYRTNLEEVAKLEPCGLYYQPGTADADEISYVLSRTAGAHRKYYFRELQSGSWMPWTEVAIDCDGSGSTAQFERTELAFDTKAGMPT